MAWYLDLVLPQEFGTPEPPLFFISLKYWRRFFCYCWEQKVVQDDQATFERLRHELFPQISELQSPDELNLEHSDPTSQSPVGLPSVPQDHIQQVPGSMKSAAKVLVSGLRKRYPDGKLAVKSISLAMLEGQITCLLGSNGALRWSSCILPHTLLI